MKNPPTPKWILCIALVALAQAWLPTLAHGQIPGVWKGQSKHYVIHTDLTIDAIRPWADHMDSVYEGYDQLLRGFPDRDAGQKQNLYLLKTRDGYLKTLKTFEIDGSGSGGMFFISPRGRGLIAYIGDQSPRQVQGVLQHEGFHQFASSRIGFTLPVWANEGLAEYFEQAIVINGKFEHGLATRGRVEGIQAALKNNKTIPFDKLLDISNEEWSDNVRTGHRDSRMQYLQSWSIVHFLIHGDNKKYQKAFDRYLRVLAEGHEHEQAFATAFGTRDRSAFGKRWKAFVREQLEVDALTEAIDRLSFLAECTRLLIKELDGKAIDADQLFDQLKAYGFESRPIGKHGPEPVAKSTRDPDIFTYINQRGHKQTFKARENQNTKLPPTIAAEGLHPTPQVKWLTQEGALLFQVVYSKR